MDNHHHHRQGLGQETKVVYNAQDKNGPIDRRPTSTRTEQHWTTAAATVRIESNDQFWLAILEKDGKKEG